MRRGFLFTKKLYICLCIGSILLSVSVTGCTPAETDKGSSSHIRSGSPSEALSTDTASSPESGSEVSGESPSSNNGSSNNTPDETSTGVQGSSGKSSGGQAASSQKVSSTKSVAASSKQSETPAQSSVPTDNTAPLKYDLHLPSSPGTVTYGNELCTIDASNTALGYIMVKYTGTSKKVKIQLTLSGSATYNYNANPGSYDVFPLTAGSGSYTVNVCENISGTSYAIAFTKQFSVALKDGTSQYLYPNQYVNFSGDSAAVKKGAELTRGISSKLSMVSNIYNFVIGNVKYDKTFAQEVQNGGHTGYIPSPDKTLSTLKGVCFDYAVLMTAMLRSQGIPARLEIGYVSGNVKHAWISVYLTESGWINGIIQFDGKSWKLMDPTYAAASQDSNTMKFIGDGKNYVTTNYY